MEEITLKKNHIIGVLVIVLMVFSVKGILLIKRLRGNVQALTAQNEQMKKDTSSTKSDVAILFSFIETELPAQQKDFSTKFQAYLAKIKANAPTK